MTIHIDSFGSALACILSLFSVLSVVVWAHWRLFMEPRIKRCLRPFGLEMSALARVLRLKFPIEFDQARADAQSDAGMGRV